MRAFDISRRSMLAAAAAVIAVCAPGGAAFAQNFPTKPITILVGFAPGGLTDVLARLLAPTMSQELGQAVVIENKAGASGNVATELVVKAPADGHTLLFSNISQIAINPHAYAAMRVDPVKQLTHIAAIAEGDMLLAVNADVPANNVQEFVKLAKDQPGKLNYFTSGAGGMLHVAAEVFKLKTGTNISPVHYRGSGASIPEFLAGQTQMGIEALPVLAQHVKSGKVKALMVPSTKRSPILPDVPTSAEAGYPDLILTAWFGLHAPQGTPPATISKISAALAKAIKNPEVQSKLEASGMLPVYDTPEKFAARIANDNKLYGDAIKATNIKVE